MTDEEKDALVEMLGNIQELKNGLMSPKLQEFMHKRYIQPLIDEGYLIEKRLLKSYLKLNFDRIHADISAISFNAALSLEIIKEIIDEVDESALFNVKQYMEDMESRLVNREELPPPPSNIFQKFVHSYMCHISPLTFVFSVLTMKQNGENIKDYLRK